MRRQRVAVDDFCKLPEYRCLVCNAWEGFSVKQRRVHEQCCRKALSLSSDAEAAAVVRRTLQRQYSAACGVMRCVDDFLDKGQPPSCTYPAELYTELTVLARGAQQSMLALETCCTIIGLALNSFDTWHADWAPLVMAVVERADDFWDADAAGSDDVRRQQCAFTARAWIVAVTWLLGNGMPCDTATGLAEVLVTVARARRGCATVQWLCFTALNWLVRTSPSAWHTVVVSGALHEAWHTVRAAADPNARRAVGAACLLTNTVLAACESKKVQALFRGQWEPVVVQLLAASPHLVSNKLCRLGLQLFRDQSNLRDDVDATALTRLLHVLFAAACQQALPKRDILLHLVAAWAMFPYHCRSGAAGLFTTAPVMKLVRAWTLQLLAANTSRDNASVTAVVASACVAASRKQLASSTEVLATMASLAMDVKRASFLRPDLLHTLGACGQAGAAVLVRPHQDDANEPMVLRPSQLLLCVLGDERVCPAQGADETAPWRVTELAGVVASFLAKRGGDGCNMGVVSAAESARFRVFVRELMTEGCAWWSAAAMRHVARVLARSTGDADDGFYDDGESEDNMEALAHALRVHCARLPTTVALLLKCLEANVRRVRVALDVDDEEEGHTVAAAVEAAMTAHEDVAFVATQAMRVLAALALQHSPLPRSRLQARHTRQLALVLRCLERHGDDADLRRVVIATVASFDKGFCAK